mgnify:CR=1 FL=1
MSEEKPTEHQCVACGLVEIRLLGHESPQGRRLSPMPIKSDKGSGYHCRKCSKPTYDRLKDRY